MLTYDADVQVGGLIANVGQRMISGVAKMIINQALKTSWRNWRSTEGAAYAPARDLAIYKRKTLCRQPLASFRPSLALERRAMLAMVVWPSTPA